MDTRSSHIELAPLTFEDIDHMVEFSKQIGWDNIGTQLTPGENRICFDSFSLPGLMVAHYRVQQSIHNVFALPPGMVLFLICREKLPLVWCGRELPPTLLGIAREGLEHEVVLNPGWDSYEFMVSEVLIQQTEIFPPDFFNRTRQFEKDFLPLVNPVTDQFLTMLDTIFQLDKSSKNNNQVRVDKAQFYDMIINGLLNVVDEGLRALDAQELKKLRRPELVKRARELIMENVSDNLSVAGMSTALGVSERVLNYAFRESLGVSPLQFVQVQKLHAVRRQLKSTDLSVSDVCDLYGFNTPSRFSRQYRRLFGELPSQTRYPSGRIKG